MVLVVTMDLLHGSEDIVLVVIVVDVCAVTVLLVKMHVISSSR